MKSHCPHLGHSISHSDNHCQSGPSAQCAPTTIDATPSLPVINSAPSGHYFAACSPSPRPPSSPGTSFPVGSRGLAIVSSDRRGARGEQAALYSYTPGQVRSWARMLRREVRRNRFANLVEYGQLDLGGES